MGSATRWKARLVLMAAMLAAFLSGAGFNAVARSPVILEPHPCPVVPEDFQP